MANGPEARPIDVMAAGLPCHRVHRVTSRLGSRTLAYSWSRAQSVPPQNVSKSSSHSADSGLRQTKSWTPSDFRGGDLWRGTRGCNNGG